MTQPSPPLVCPVCRQDLDREEERLQCAQCNRIFPVLAGIPDLRLRGDRYLSLEDDRQKALALHRLSDASYAELVDEYWRRTPQVPPDLAARYANVARAGAARADAYLDHLGGTQPDAVVLDVGCGTGGSLESTARRGATAVGVDIALRWLVVAKRRLRDAGLDAVVVAADGAVLPFRQGSFDLTTCVETLEHTDDQRGLVQSCILSVRPGGTFSLVTGNRFSVAPDPNVALWGVGYLPRRWAPAYVRRRRHTRSQFLRPVSNGELRSFIGLRDDITVSAGPLPLPPPGASAVRRHLQAGYGVVCGHPVAQVPLLHVGPFLEARGRIGAGPGERHR